MSNMKKGILLGIVVSVCLAMSSAVWAESFDVSVTVPSATSLAFQVYAAHQPGTAIEAVELTSNSLDFDTNVVGNAGQANEFTITGGLTFDSVDQIYRSEKFFYVDLIGESSGGVQTSFTLGTLSYSYTEGQKGTGDANSTGLGDKCTITVTGNSGSGEALLTGGEKRRLGSADTISITGFSGIFIRSYIGISDGTDDGVIGTLTDALQSEPFTLADIPGPYTGTLTITATL